MRGIKVLLATLFVFLFCNTAFAKATNIKSAAVDTPKSFSLMAALNADDSLVNYRRGADDGAAPDDKKGRGRGHGRDD
ncbi:MAG: hypothetical protein ACE5G9_08000 [Nitrospinales bacterium]